MRDQYAAFSSSDGENFTVWPTNDVALFCALEVDSRFKAPQTLNDFLIKVRVGLEAGRHSP